MNQPKIAGLLYGFLEHHLDHLGVFCSLMQIPLIVTDEHIYQLATVYYSHLQLIYWDAIEAPFKILQNFECIFSSLPRILCNEIFFLASQSYKKTISTIWIPHGNSDKGYVTGFMQQLKHETSLLVQGPKMIDFIQESLGSSLIPPYIQLGNYRFDYYQKHQEFYSSIVQKLQLPKKRTLLYAPTWKDPENSSSFFDITSHLIEQLPNDYFLIIKPHINLLQNIQTHQIIAKYENFPNLKFLIHFTPIYPILNQIDVYMGDMSSVGYDFLTFNRPMIFFCSKNNKLSSSRFLHQCGMKLYRKNYSNIFNVLEKEFDQLSLTTKRQEVYNYTFGSQKSWSKIQDLIYQKFINKL